MIANPFFSQLRTGTGQQCSKSECPGFDAKPQLPLLLRYQIPITPIAQMLGYQVPITTLAQMLKVGLPGIKATGYDDIRLVEVKKCIQIGLNYWNYADRI